MYANRKIKRSKITLKELPDQWERQIYKVLRGS